MADLRKRFGRILAAHRRRKGLTQEALAEAAGLSVDMISKIEVGATGARFPSIERLATAVDVDPAELFTNEIPSGSIRRGSFGEVSAKLAALSENDLVWINDLIDTALARGRIPTPSPGTVKPKARAGKSSPKMKKRGR